VAIRMSRKPGDLSPGKAHDAKVEHCAALLIHAGPEQFNSLSVVKRPFQVRRCGTGEPIEPRSIDILNASMLLGATKGLPAN
jgi:hypothetical protein